MSKMDDSDDNLLNLIRQCQTSIMKHSALGNDAKILHYISKLYDMPVTVAHLQETGIGRTVNALRKYNGNVGNAARAIVYKWKTMVAKEEDEVENDEDNDAESKSPPPSPDDRKMITSERETSKPRKTDSSERSVSSQESSSSRHKSHKIDRKSDSHRSSHSRDSERRSHSSEPRKHKHEEKSRSDRKRKHKDDDKHSRSSKRRYESDNASDNDSGTPSIEPDSSNYNDTLLEDNYEDIPQEDFDNYQSPVSETNHKHKKHHKSDKHRKHDTESEREKHVNGSEKKSHHRESKHSSEKTKKDKPGKSEVNVKSEPIENGRICDKSEVKEIKINKKSSSSTKVINSTKVKKGLLIDNDNGIDSGSGASFAEALGMMQPTSTNKSTKKRSSTVISPTSVPSSSKISKTPISTPSTSSQNPDLLSPDIKLEPLEINLATQLPEITTNYRPLNNFNPDASPVNHIKHMTEEEALSVVITSKTQRTKVFSGNKTNWGFVPTLFNLCVRVLQDNIDSLEYTGGVPYTILKPVLERATADQLLNTEYHNPYLVEESDVLWELHCKRQCRGKQRQEMESWRDMYLRCRDERDAKLKALTVNIKQSIDKSAPIRQTKLAYVDTVAKPPRGVARKQAKYGTDKKPMVTPTARLNSIASSCGGEKVSVPNPGARAAASSGAIIKPKKAPLMQKTLALIKSRYRR